MRVVLRCFVVLSLISITISSAGLKGSVSPASRILALDAEALKGWKLAKAAVSVNAADHDEETKGVLSDDEIGITEFVNKKIKGIGGQIKTTWSDYRVFEIRDRDNAVVTLKHAKDPGTPAEKQMYVRFALAKAGYDTMAAVNRLASFSGIPRAAFTWAGVKETRAITCQEMTLRVKMGAKTFNCNKLLEVEKKFPRIMVGNLEFCSEPLGISSPCNSHYTILLRNLAVTKRSKIQEAVEAVAKHGFINYFSHHRFGLGQKGCLNMVKVGKALLHRRWDEAVSLAMSPEGASDEAEAAAKTRFAADWAALPAEVGPERAKAMRAAAAAAHRSLPPHCGCEIALVGGLSRGLPPPRALALMTQRNAYILAYWARIWNLCASARLRLHGAAVVAGDLVVVRATADAGPAAAAASGAADVRTVTAEDVAKGRYTIFDVVLPMPAQAVEVTYPDNQAGRYMRELLDAEGLRGTVCDKAAVSAAAGAGAGAAAVESPGKGEGGVASPTDKKKKKKGAAAAPAEVSEPKKAGKAGKAGKAEAAAAAAAAPAAAEGSGGEEGGAGKGGGERHCLFRHLMMLPGDLEWDVLQYSKDEDLQVVSDNKGGRFIVSPQPAAAAAAGEGKGAGEGDAPATPGKRKRGAADKPAKVAKGASPAAAAEGAGEERNALQVRFSLPANSFPTSMLRELTKETFHPMKRGPAKLTNSPAKA